MSLHINRFIDRLRAAESRQQREVSLSIHEARDLHADITKLLVELEQRRVDSSQTPEVVTVQITGGTFR